MHSSIYAWNCMQVIMYDMSDYCINVHFLFIVFFWLNKYQVIIVRAQKSDCSTCLCKTCGDFLWKSYWVNFFDLLSTSHFNLKLKIQIIIIIKLIFWQVTYWPSYQWSKLFFNSRSPFKILVAPMFILEMQLEEEQKSSLWLSNEECFHLTF